MSPDPGMASAGRLNLGLDRAPEAAPPRGGPATTVSTSDAMLERLVRSTEEGDRRIADATARRTAAREQAIDAIRTAPALPEIPEIRGLPDVPRLTFDAETYRGFSTTAALFAALSGAFTREPMVNAMNALAGAVEGFVTGERELAKLNLQQWKAETESAVQAHTFQTDRYKAILEARNMTLAEKLQAFQLEATAAGDEIAAEQARRQNLTEIMKLLDKRQEAARKLQFDYDKLGIEYGHKARELASLDRYRQGLLQNAENKLKAKAEQLTPSYRAMLERQMGGLNNSLDKLHDLSGKINNVGNAMLGASGKWYSFMSRGPGQIYAQATDPEIEAVRTDLLLLNEQIKKTISRDPSRPSNKEAEDIQRILVSPGLFESRERAMAVMERLQNFLVKDLEQAIDTYTGGPQSLIDRTKRTLASPAGLRTQYPAPPQEAIDDLRAKPETAPYFDEGFGPGAAARYLRQ